VARLEVGGAAAGVDVLAVHEPQVMHAARVRARGVKEGDLTRPHGIGDVEEIDAGRRHAGRRRLVRHREQVARKIKRVRPHLVVR
jgi:hypothetical protein